MNPVQVIPTNGVEPTPAWVVSIGLLDSVYVPIFYKQTITELHHLNSHFPLGIQTTFIGISTLFTFYIFVLSINDIYIDILLNYDL